MYRDIAPELLEIVEPVVRSHGLELVDVERSGVPGRGLRLRVVLDTERGDGRVTVDECARVSREVGHGLDAADALRASYVLEVCSPGVDRILARWVDFERVVGREVQVELRSAMDGRRRFRGALEACEGESIQLVLPEQGERVSIPFAQVAKAKAFYGDETRGKG